MLKQVEEVVQNNPIQKQRNQNQKQLNQNQINQISQVKFKPKNKWYPD